VAAAEAELPPGVSDAETPADVGCSPTAVSARGRYRKTDGCRTVRAPPSAASQEAPACSWTHVVGASVAAVHLQALHTSNLASARSCCDVSSMATQRCGRRVVRTVRCCRMHARARHRTTTHSHLGGLVVFAVLALAVAAVFKSLEQVTGLWNGMRHILRDIACMFEMDDSGPAIVGLELCSAADSTSTNCAASTGVRESDERLGAEGRRCT